MLESQHQELFCMGRGSWIHSPWYRNDIHGNYPSYDTTKPSLPKYFTISHVACWHVGPYNHSGSPRLPTEITPESTPLSVPRDWIQKHGPLGGETHVMFCEVVETIRNGIEMCWVSLLNKFRVFFLCNKHIWSNEMMVTSIYAFTVI